MKGFGNAFEGFKELIRKPGKDEELNEAMVVADTKFEEAVAAHDEVGVQEAIETLKKVGPRGYAEQLQTEWENLKEDA